MKTALEILVKNRVFESTEINMSNLVERRDGHVQLQRDIKLSMIEFAEYHVIQALEKLRQGLIDDGYMEETDKLIYSLKDIK